MGIHPHFDLKAKQMNNQYKLQSQHTYHPTNRYMNTTTQNYSGTPDRIANLKTDGNRHTVCINNEGRLIHEFDLQGEPNREGKSKYSQYLIDLQAIDDQADKLVDI